MPKKSAPQHDVETYNTGSLWAYRIDGGDEVGGFQSRDGAIAAAMYACNPTLPADPSYAIPVDEPTPAYEPVADPDFIPVS